MSTGDDALVCQSLVQALSMAQAVARLWAARPSDGRKAGPGE